MKTIHLTDCEAKVVKELLEREQAELQPEIHHTDTVAVRTQLREKAQTVTRLIERLNETESVHGHACACKHS